MAFSFSPLIGIAGAAVLGGAIGVQRQAAAKAAGFRTHVLVAAASAAFTAMGAHLHDTRIPSYVVVGIGFLGAGAIVRRGNTPQGLTTAASIWMAAAVGLSMGYANSFGLWVALLATAITLLALGTSDAGLMASLRVPAKHTLHVLCRSEEDCAARIAGIIRAAGFRIEESDVSSMRWQDGAFVAELYYIVESRPHSKLSGVLRAISELDAVQRVDCAEPPFFGT